MRRVILFYYLRTSSATGGGGGGGRGGVAKLFLFHSVPLQQTTNSGIGHRVKYGVVFFGLSINTLNVRNNNLGAAQKV